MNIYIKLEIETRELTSRLVLGMHAAAKGHQVLIGDDEFQGSYSKTLDIEWQDNMNLAM